MGSGVGLEGTAPRVVRSYQSPLMWTDRQTDRHDLKTLPFRHSVVAGNMHLN